MPSADRAILGARIRTLDPKRPFATAVAFRDGVIIEVGDDASVRAVCDGATDIIDGSSLAIVSGLTDSHIHPFWGAQATQGVDLSDVWTIDQLRFELAAAWEQKAGQGWITGWGLHFEPFLETGIRGDLFADAVGDAPTYLGFFDGHTAVAGPSALALAGITGPRQFSETAAIVCDPDGSPMGELQESAAMLLVRDVVPPLSAEEEYRLYADTLITFAANGLTALHAMDGQPATFDLLRELEGNGDLPVRIISPLWQQPEMSFDEIRAQLPLRDERGKRWRGGVAKFFIDGVIESGTAWLVEPDTKGAGTLPFWPDPEKYQQAVGIFAEAGFQCATHAVGDMATRCALDAYERYGAAPNIRHRIEHIEQLQDSDLPRFAELDVTASMQILHMHAFEADGTDEWSARVGPERLATRFRSGDLKRAGARIALGSDWMVAPYDPRLGMAWARLRRRPGQPDRPPLGPEQALSALDTLEGYTTEAVRAVSEEDSSGRIMPGYRADLTAFATDPVDCDADALIDLPVLLTVVDGDVIFRQEA
jgi:predicted amidohydrolase YtcJ